MLKLSVDNAILLLIFAAGVCLQRKSTGKFNIAKGFVSIQCFFKKFYRYGGILHVQI